MPSPLRRDSRRSPGEKAARMPLLTKSLRVNIRKHAMIIAFACLWSCVSVTAQSSGKQASRNEPPVVILTASPTRLCLGGEVKLFADARDPDGDKLTYKYTTRVGQIVGQGRHVRWRLGGMGYYDVEVEVSDGH